MKNAADGHEWAQYFYQEILPIRLHGPIIADEKCCRWPRMGPLFLLRNGSNDLEWAHYR